MNVQIKSNKSRTKFGLNYLRNKDGLKILRLLAEGTPQSIIAEKYSFGKTKVNYWCNKFLKKGLIRINIPGKPIFYELTALGSKIVTGSELVWPPPVIMEDYAVKFGLINDFSGLDWEKLGKPNNWVKLGVKIGGCQVVKTSKNIIIHTGQLRGFNLDELFFEAGQIIEMVIDFLKYRGVEMDDVGFPLHEPYIRFYPPEAEIINEKGTYYTQNGSIDCSPPEKVPHVEYGHKTALNYLQMPNRIERIEHNMQTLFKVIDEIRGLLKERSLG